ANADRLSADAWPVGLLLMSRVKKAEFKARPRMTRAHDARADDEHHVCLLQLLLDRVVNALARAQTFLVVEDIDIVAKGIVKHRGRRSSNLLILMSVADEYVKLGHSDRLPRLLAGRPRAGSKPLPQCECRE